MECERDYIVSFILKSVFLEFDMISLGEWVMGFMTTRRILRLHLIYWKKRYIVLVLTLLGCLKISQYHC